MSIVERLITDKLISRVSVEDICEDIIQAQGKDKEAALSVLAVAIRNSDRKFSASSLRYFAQMDKSCNPEIYLDIAEYSAKESDIPSIYKLGANNILRSALLKKLIGNEEALFRHLGKRLNFKGIEIAVREGKRPSYTIFDAIVDTLCVTERIIKDKIVLETSYKLAADIIGLLISHGYELDNIQKSKMLPSVLNKLSTVTDPQWKRECRIPKGNTSPRLRSLANDMGIDSSTSKETICSTITEYAKMSLDDIIKRGEESMANSLDSKLFRVLPPDTTDNEIRVYNNSLYRTKKRTPYQYGPSSVIKYGQYYFVEEQFGSIVRTGRNPYTADMLPEDIIAKAESRLDQLSHKGTIKSIAKRITENDEDGEEKYQIKIEEKFYNILCDYRLQHVILDLRSMLPSDIEELSLYTLGAKEVITLRSYINKFFDSNDRQRALHKLSKYFK